jgi:cellulose synthase/poly-beta-1,6-N-acetylglucosamine synthase-like glycosyltransferase
MIAAIGSLMLALGLGYVFINVQFVRWWKRIPVFEAGLEPQTTISVVIAARNEEENLKACLDAILAQNYPASLLDVIVVDDHSEDGTAKLVQAFVPKGVRLLKVQEHHSQISAGGKKAALKLGIENSQAELIVTTDADCVAGKEWLAQMATFYQTTQAKAIAAPVNFYQEKNGLQKFQSLDFLGMMLLTGAGIHASFMRMGNGANLAYPRQVFWEVNGFEGIEHLASGDDMLLLHKIAARYSKGVHFLKSSAATVFTPAQPDLRSFWQQRTRWATKNAAYQEWKITAVLAWVFFTCWAVLLGILGLVWFWPILGLATVLLLALKMLADYYLLHQAADFFGRKDLLRFFLPAQIMHILYIALIGLWANVQQQYIWKGRKQR